MDFENEFSQLAAVIGDKSRSVMLWNLLDGRAYTATELSLCADISPQAASNHLSKLIDARILIVEKQGRHRYYRYANSEVAQIIESMASLLPTQQGANGLTRPKPGVLTYARTCYDHLAGKVGVAITDSLIKKEIIQPLEKKYVLTSFGVDWFLSFGINIADLRLSKRAFAFQCLDWSERRHHLAGALGASMLRQMLKKDWLRRVSDSREVLITPIGKMKLKDELALEL